MARMTGIAISSDAFEDGGRIPRRHGYKNGNVSPTLSFSGVPEGAKSLALIMDDPDAMKPAGKVWSHWIVWNMPPDTARIDEGSAPPAGAVQGTTDFGSTGYGGPAPPDAEHTYVFAVYALDAEIELGESATKQQLEQAIRPHVMAKAEMRGRYSPD